MRISRPIYRRPRCVPGNRHRTIAATRRVRHGSVEAAAFAIISSVNLTVLLTSFSTCLDDLLVRGDHRNMVARVRGSHGEAGLHPLLTWATPPLSR